MDLPRNGRKNALALKAVNKRWRKLPGDVHDLVSQNMSRATPSATAIRLAFDPGYDVYLGHVCCVMHHCRKRRGKHGELRRISWKIYLYDAKAKSQQFWETGQMYYRLEDDMIRVGNTSNIVQHYIDYRSEHEMRCNPKPHIMLADGRRLLI